MSYNRNTGSQNKKVSEYFYSTLNLWITVWEASSIWKPYCHRENGQSRSYAKKATWPEGKYFEIMVNEKQIKRNGVSLEKRWLEEWQDSCASKLCPTGANYRLEVSAQNSKEFPTIRLAHKHSKHELWCTQVALEVTCEGRVSRVCHRLRFVYIAFIYLRCLKLQNAVK